MMGWFEMKMLSLRSVFGSVCSFYLYKKMLLPPNIQPCMPPTPKHSQLSLSSALRPCPVQSRAPQLESVIHY